jgi:hypothetical protein
LAIADCQLPIGNRQSDVTLVDGTLLPARPSWRRPVGWTTLTGPLSSIPTKSEVRSKKIELLTSDFNGDERLALAQTLQPERVYVLDRGYLKFGLFQAILERGSSLVCRVHDHMAFEVLEDRALSEEARAAGVVGDAVVRFGGPPIANWQLAIGNYIRSAGAAGGGHRPDLQTPLGHRDLLPLFQARAGVPALAQSRQQWD